MKRTAIVSFFGFAILHKSCVMVLRDILPGDSVAWGTTRDVFDKQGLT